MNNETVDKSVVEMIANESKIKDRIFGLLISAGYITQDQIDAARALLKMSDEIEREKNE